MKRTSNEASARVLDFSRCDSFRNDHQHYQAHLQALRGGAIALTELRLPTVLTFDDNGKLIDHTPRWVPERRIKRARRILWEVKQRQGRPSEYFKHPELKDVPYQVLKRLVKESEGGQ